jgi:hypothetical protein
MIRTKIACVFAICAGLFLLSAQSPFPGQLPPGIFTNRAALDASSAPPSYTGPGDVVSGAVAWWGLRAYSSATRGNKAVNVCNSTGGVDVGCGDLSTDATTGALVAATISGITCPGTNCTVKIIYDQTAGNNCGNGGGTSCDLSQATISLRPLLKASCIGSLPCLDQSAGTSAGLDTAATFSPNIAAQPFVASCVFNYVDNTDAFLMGITGGTQVRLNQTGAGLVGLFAGSAFDPDVTTSQNAFHAIQATFNGASSEIYLDGSGTTGNPGTAALSNSQFGYMARGEGALPMKGYSTELGLWSTTFTSGQKTSMNSNQHTYWGF